MTFREFKAQAEKIISLGGKAIIKISHNGLITELPPAPCMIVRNEIDKLYYILSNDSYLDGSESEKARTYGMKYGWKPGDSAFGVPIQSIEPAEPFVSEDDF